ncbi:unnamed protein product [Candidula unifasciata]|uniref:Histone-lysine N-methyltransferase n=1 Tax=Candidula unifasciata TaxID=100452 RepID=A0A8S3YRQ4_9EUPU|nr:unnamed protein product [Candidula unifasciata]
MKACSVPCLLDIVELQQLIERDGLQLSQETKEYLLYMTVKRLGPNKSQKLISKFVDDELLEWKDDYEVESILNNCKNEQDGQMYYLIKWVGWGHEHNTWEPEQNLCCEDLLQDYKKLMNTGQHQKKKFPDPKQEDLYSLKKTKIDEFFQKLMESKILDIISPLDIIRSYNANKRKSSSNGMIVQYQPKLRIRKRKVSQKVLRQEATRALKAWQDKLNSISRGYDPAPLAVENNVDLEGPPEDFIYINERKEGPGVVIPKDPLIGCDCEDCYQNRKGCCVVAAGSVLAYYKSNGRLRVSQGVPIYECNIRCKCGPDCMNRVVQKGRKVKICIFRTPNGRGWGVKTLQKVKKGAFIMEYVGEVITNEEAERRGKEYDAVGRTYLFDLDFHDDDAPYSVDAGTHGNAAHFINHSCNPNLEVHVVWINTLDPQLPHICLYAKRDIECNEELTFDYMSEFITSDQTARAQLAAIVESSSLNMAKSEQSETLVADLGDVQQSLTQSLQEILERGNTEPSEEVAEQQNDINSWGDLPTPSSDSQSLADENGNAVAQMSRKSHFSMACLCGATNCRKFLFF